MYDKSDVKSSQNVSYLFEGPLRRGLENASLQFGIFKTLPTKTTTFYIEGGVRGVPTSATRSPNVFHQVVSKFVLDGSYWMISGI